MVMINTGSVRLPFDPGYKAGVSSFNVYFGNFYRIHESLVDDQQA